MDAKAFSGRKTGQLIETIQKCMAFVPDPLPPKTLDLASLVPAVAQAQHSLGELSGIGRTLQNPYLLVSPFMRKEAVASSKIEGTVTTISELFLFEVDKETSRSSQDTREVWNYVRALEHSLHQLNEIPISLRLIKNAHRILLTNVAKSRGAGIIPGEFKKDQNWIGARLIENARYIPPPPKEAEEGMYDLEKYIHSEGASLPLIVKLALIHYQFEAIHPFPDGNGRVGRLMIPLILCERKEISQPLLYLSPFFENNYDEYIDRMLDVSAHGLWEDWIEFFLRGVEESCNSAITTAKRLQDLQSEYHSRIQRARSSALLGQLIDLLFEHPAITIPNAAFKLEIAYNGAKNNINRLVEHEILQPVLLEHRPKVFLAPEIVRIISS